MSILMCLGIGNSPFTNMLLFSVGARAHLHSASRQERFKYSRKPKWWPGQKTNCSIHSATHTLSLGDRCDFVFETCLFFLVYSVCNVFIHQWLTCSGWWWARLSGRRSCGPCGGRRGGTWRRAGPRGRATPWSGTAEPSFSLLPVGNKNNILVK